VCKEELMDQQSLPEALPRILPSSPARPASSRAARRAEQALCHELVAPSVPAEPAWNSRDQECGQADAEASMDSTTTWASASDTSWTVGRAGSDFSLATSAASSGELDPMRRHSGASDEGDLDTSPSPPSSLRRGGRPLAKKKVSFSGRAETLRVPLLNGARLTPLTTVRGSIIDDDLDDLALSSTMSIHLSLSGSDTD
ncbi:unnamed protein product, partial [Prorocentrum cordatum]